MRSDKLYFATFWEISHKHMWAKYSKYCPVVQLLQTTIFQFLVGKKKNYWMKLLPLHLSINL